MRSLYTLSIYLYGAAISIAALFNPKAKKWIKGRSGMWERLAQGLSGKPGPIWIHASSVGEFEQGRPLIERIRADHPDSVILLTFFSPSGLEHFRDYPLVDMVEYIPLDTPGKMNRFTETVRPSLAIFIKYEFWFNALRALRHKNVPVLFISTQFRADQWFLKPWGGFAANELRATHQIITADKTSLDVLKRNRITNAQCCGDTRVDRVMSIASSHEDFSYLRERLEDNPVLVAGSTWPEDLGIICPAINQGVCSAIIAPHEVNESQLRQIEKQLTVPAIRLSELASTNGNTYSAIIVDSMGKLASIYHIGQVAYIGGGFGDGIHNTTEAIVYGLPVAFGPDHQKFNEALELIQRGAATCVVSPGDFSDFLGEMLDERRRQMAQEQIEELLGSHRGATECIYLYIRSNQLLADVVAT